MIWAPFPAYTSVRGRGQVGVATINMTAEKVWYSILFSLYACKYGERKNDGLFLSPRVCPMKQNTKEDWAAKLYDLNRDQFLFFSLLFFSSHLFLF